jgi:geranylgeranyl reductase family protein
MTAFAPDLHRAAPALLPARCDVLVVGAGPAGSACALTLARAGLDVVLVDQQAFPRDKVCGDGLIPDAHEALRHLGLYDVVMARAQAVPHVACFAPRGGRVDVPGRLAVLPRRELDDLLKQGAEQAGARFFAPWRFEAPLLGSEGLGEGHDGEARVIGARLTSTGAGAHEVRARWVVLATGAVPKALMAAGLCERHTPSCVALRAYVRHPAMSARITDLEVVWHPALRGGYGWIFPAPEGVFNIGVGLSQSHARDAGGGRKAMQDVNLRDMFAAFVRVHPHAAELMAGGQVVSALKGAPMRCSLDGARHSRPGLLVTGEAAGSAYAFTGEGIGKALETGILAAEAVLAEPDEARTRDRYEAALQSLKPRFALYERASHVNAHPWLADLLIWRAQRSARVLRGMAAVLEERSNPGQLVSLRGLLKLFLP